MLTCETCVRKGLATCECWYMVPTGGPYKLHGVVDAELAAFVADDGYLFYARWAEVRREEGRVKP